MLVTVQPVFIAPVSNAFPELRYVSWPFQKVRRNVANPVLINTVRNSQVADNQFQRVIDDVLPPAPYLLRLNPGALQLAHGNSTWRRDTFFAPNEEELQYMTFRRDFEGTFLHAHGNWDDGEGGIAQPEVHSASASISRPPLPQQAPKKKITLADYQKRDKTKPKPASTDTESAGKEMHDGHSTKAKAPEITKPAEPKVIKEVPAKKGTMPTETNQKSAHAQKHTPQTDSMSTKQPVANPKSSLEGKKQGAASSKLPEISAPTTKTPPTLHGLPPMLSPTLPATIEAELAKRGAPSRPSSVSPLPKTQKQDPPKPKTKVVVLKIKKANRRQLSQYLKLKPTPTPKRDTPSNIAKDVKASPSVEKPTAVTTATKRKSPKEDELEHEQAAKRRKVPWLPQKSTPSKDSGVAGVSSSKIASSRGNNLATPAAAVKSAAMNRTQSQESTATPLKPSSETTPNVNHKVDSPTRLQWISECKSEFKRFITMATEIKHQSDKFLKQTEAPTLVQRKLGAVIATESVLCFILAAMIDDEPCRTSNQPGNPRLWKSTRSFISALAGNHARPFQHLYGFLYQLEGLISDTLEYHIDVRIENIFREYNKLKGKESAGEAATNAEEYINKYYHSLLKDSHENRLKSRTAWREGEAALYHSEMAQKFPKSWGAQRGFPGRGKGRDPVYLKQYARDGYALPMGTNTTGLEAVNFGLRFLSEFCQNEKLEWKPTLVI